MTLKEIPSKVQTTDGQEFLDKNAAEKHQEFIDIKAEYKNVKAKYATMLWESQFTADGERFVMSGLKDYWYVACHSYRPCLCKVSFYLWNCELNNNDELEIIHLEKNAERYYYKNYKINELYAKKENAEKKLLDTYKDSLKWLSEDIEELEAKLNKP